ncbi:hypothetical protein SCLCIDRAFT_1017771 [Scleroderma citrinum Foug A]|uniref:Uncharacterized protein n=1 Tax=Scleroderma citrinum Foug A TaxID=1036808 RepID=A0A0C3E685_9AGAM|nr:hypothetical protein SCLCIDRAFT_1017771 [Scleroderma citrinum Foug A]
MLVRSWMNVICKSIPRVLHFHLVYKVTPTGNASPSFEHPRLQSPRKYICFTCLCEGPGSLAHEFSTDNSVNKVFAVLDGLILVSLATGFCHPVEVSFDGSNSANLNALFMVRLPLTATTGRS